MFNVHRTIRLLWGGGGGRLHTYRYTGEKGSGGRVTLYLSLHCHHQNGSCIKVGSDESHFKVSLIVRDSHKTASTTFLTEES